MEVTPVAKKTQLAAQRCDHVEVGFFGDVKKASGPFHTLGGTALSRTSLFYFEINKIHFEKRVGKMESWENCLIYAMVGKIESWENCLIYAMVGKIDCRESVQSGN